MGVHPSSLGYEAILKFTDDPPKFWTPAMTDDNPSLTVHFKQNRVITAIELRGETKRIFVCVYIIKGCFNMCLYRCL